MRQGPRGNYKFWLFLSFFRDLGILDSLPVFTFQGYSRASCITDALFLLHVLFFTNHDLSATCIVQFSVNLLSFASSFGFTLQDLTRTVLSHDTQNDKNRVDWWAVTGMRIPSPSRIPGHGLPTGLFLFSAQFSSPSAPLPSHFLACPSDSPFLSVSG